MPLTRDDPDTWFQTIWPILHQHREENIPEGDPSYDDQWSDITTAMAWIKEALEPNMISEAVACMWERALYLCEHDEAWKEFVEGNGYAATRMEVIQHAATLDADYRSVSGDDNVNCFDWDFVPEWMSANLVLGDMSIRLAETRTIPKP